MIEVGGPQAFTGTVSATAISPGIPHAGIVLILASTTAPALTTGGSESTAAATSTSSAPISSSGNAIYGSRGLAIALGIIGVGLTAMFAVV